MNDLKLTVKDILARDSFKSAKLIAGVEGLDRQVKWSHILETKEFDSLINGGELILTTGIGLQLNLPDQLKYVKRLIEKGAACICIEIGPYFKEIPFELIELSNKVNFPLIIFKEVVKFVDITQDLHSFIINQHHLMLSQLDQLSRKFIALSLTHNGILKILQELHEHFGENTFFINDDAKPYYYPSEIKNVEISLRTYIEKASFDTTEQRTFSIGEDTFALMPVKVLGQVWGNLYVQIKHPPLSKEFFFLILDRAALAIAQILLRNRTIEERKQNLEDELVRNLLNGREYEHDDLQTYLPSSSRNMHFRIFMIQIDSPIISISEEEWDEIKLQRSMMVRSLFKRHGFFPAVSARRNEITVIASFIAADHIKKETNRFLQITNGILKMKDNNFIDGNRCAFGVSTVYTNISNMKKAYEEAREVLKHHELEITTSNFYEDLGIYRLLLLLKKSGHLEIYIDEYLGYVIEYDRKMNSNLLETLSVYLECSGSKKETSDRLFIVRQTLYHRLDRLETLLGKDFMEPANRLAIEVAIKAHELISDDFYKKDKTGFSH
ncbi:PucR family transcriptional regulator [Sporosarcina luteola]|uniref:PucR family transcriptional regulator n=1 Tax=Sporosarcina luteola TaxID=582850 RepID=UPI00203ACB99|nr:PucR family transcriptional regulator [Sporosarcina luteola]MCM3709191.1 PucR family transcriptional regulator ligand-binding domain-containing protein [Sporosarcina luteola]